MAIDIYKIKLVIWDLDDTFWKGTLSEGGINMIKENIDLANKLIDKGIMNSICSKNTYDDVKKILEENNLWDLFVFPSIDWSAKGPRIKELINTMGLRPTNVLFIDDNTMNLNEASFFMPELMTLNASELEFLYNRIDNIKKNDKEHNRLKQYRVLEKKNKEKESVGSTEAFLKQSDIMVSINNDCMDELERIEELIGRTNQLNFTKIRSSKEEIINTLRNKDFKCGTVSVKDKYGDYGLVGFYALNIRTNTLLHFLFSCRTIGMGIEQYVYEHLKFPKLYVIGEVINQVETKNIVSWIKLDNGINNNNKTNNGYLNDKEGKLVSILFKSPCDLSSVMPYLGKKNNVDIVCEFNYVNNQGVTISAFNNTTHIIESLSLNDKQINEIIADAPFLDKSAFITKTFERKWDFIFMSILPDEHEGVYLHKKTGIKICFSSANYDLTNENNWEKFILGKYTNHGFNFTKDILKRFKDNFIFTGYMKPYDIVNNLIAIRERLNKNTKLILMLGSEIDHTDNTEEFANHAENNVHVNREIISAFSSKDNIEIINYTKYITSQDCFSDCINHFSRKVYFEIAQDIIKIINSKKDNANIKIKNNFLIALINMKSTLSLYWRKLKKIKI